MQTDRSVQGEGGAEQHSRTLGPLRWVLVLTVVLYGFTVFVIAFGNRDVGLNESRPRFQTQTLRSLPALPESDDLETSVVLFRPTSFDDQQKRLSIEIQLRPAPTVGDHVGDSFEILGSRVLLQFPGAIVENASGASSVLLEGSPGVVSPRLLAALRDSGPPYSSVRSSEAFTAALEANARSRLEDVTLFGPLAVSVSPQTYGRAFRVTDNIFWFPFDSYGFSLNVIAKHRPTVDLYSEELLADELPPWVMPINLLANRGAVGVNNTGSFQVGNWQIRYRPTHYLGLGDDQSADRVAESWSVGLGTVLFQATRPVPVRILTGIFGLVYVASAAALLIVVRRISNGSRPPTGNMLVWAAALIFAAVSLRQGLPGEVPVGVLFDWIFLFPTLLVAIASTLDLAIRWVRRTDYTP